MKQFHLSIGVKSLQESAFFFEQVLGAKITHGDFNNLDEWLVSYITDEDDAVETLPEYVRKNVNLPTYGSVIILNARAENG